MSIKQMSIADIQQFLGVSYAAARAHISRNKWHKYRNNHKKLMISVPYEQLKDIKERLAKSSVNCSPISSPISSVNMSEQVQEWKTQWKEEKVERITTHKKLQKVYETLVNREELIAELKLKNAHQTKENQYLEGEQAKLNKEIEQLKQERKKDKQHNNELARQLKLTSRSWWRKLLGVP